jgi:hypothetical protein
VRFEPWLATGRGTLIPDFFSALATVLGKERRYKEQVARAVDLLRAFARSFMSTQPANLIPPQAVKAGIDSAPSFTGQRANLADILAKIDLPIIVLVDDVDSLDATDLRALMQSMLLIYVR